MMWMTSSGKFFRGGAVGAIALLSLGSLSAAQQSKAVVPVVKPDPQRSVDAEPHSTVASFGDWILRCQRIGNGADKLRVCEVAQQIRTQDQQIAVAEVAIGHLKKVDPLRLTIVLPTNVTFPNPPSFSAHGQSPEPLDLSWRKCLPGGCIADAPLKDDVLRRWKTLTSAGRITWTDAGGRDLAVGLSFRGLTQALDALKREL